MASSSTTIEGSQNATSLDQDEKSFKGPDPNLSSNSTEDVAEEVDSDVLQGSRAFMLVFAISLAGFLYALDVTIIVTVSSATSYTCLGHGLSTGITY
jgi:hypothetical protein